ncbi:MAG: hypothetical protein NZ777_10135 [Pseudomonadales bacterium]|nr:hypothetical protein [Pseudomonadales bacterium]
MFKVFAFLKRNTGLLTHNEYRAGHVGYHCGQSRRLKDIRGYLVNIWSNTPFADRIGTDLYEQITRNEPRDFLDWWDGFPEVYFDNQKAWLNAANAEPDRATADGLVADPDWSMADGPVLFDPVPDRPGEFKPCHLLMHEHILIPVERQEHKSFKLMQFFKHKPNISNDQVLADYAAAASKLPGMNGCILNFRDPDQAAAMRGFYGDDTWGLSDEGIDHRARFCAMWDGAIEYHFTLSNDFVAARRTLHNELSNLESEFFDSVWYVEVDENLIVMPNRNPAPNYYFR